ncbi:Uncharacterised protein [Chlamydia trachomatis]|nr:Uncharacterised protein [Chlamydia trachomatis]
MPRIIRKDAIPNAKEDTPITAIKGRLGGRKTTRVATPARTPKDKATFNTVYSVRLA